MARKNTTVSIPRELVEEVQPFLKKLADLGEVEQTFYRQVIRVAMREGWDSRALKIPRDVKRGGDGDRVIVKLSLSLPQYYILEQHREYATFSRWYVFALRRFLDELPENPHYWQLLATPRAK